MVEMHDLFVSHSHADTVAVKEVVARWEVWGRNIFDKFKIFADFNDEKLSEASKAGIMNVELVDHLLQTIRRCRVFVFIASVSSASSGWMPWELGLAHGAVGRVHLYLLDPAAKQALAGREYLDLYRDTTFEPETAETYLARVLAKARAEAADPAQIARARLMGEMLSKLTQEFADQMKQLSSHPGDFERLFPKISRNLSDLSKETLSPLPQGVATAQGSSLYKPF